jgi:hypothetical protein
MAGVLIGVYLALPLVLNKLDDDMLVDTRSFIVEEMMEDFTPTDWVFGRGALGSYYSPYFEYTNRHGLDGDSPDRQISEIGYLHVALKAGLIGTLLYLLLGLFAVAGALAKARGRVGFGIAVFLSLHLASMLVGTQLEFTMYHIVYWMTAGSVLQLIQKGKGNEGQRSHRVVQPGAVHPQVHRQRQIPGRGGHRTHHP